MRPEDIRVGMVMVSISQGTKYTIESLNPKQCTFSSNRGTSWTTGWDDKVVCNPERFWWECEKENLFDKLYLRMQ